MSKGEGFTSLFFKEMKKDARPNNRNLSPSDQRNSASATIRTTVQSSGSVRADGGEQSSNSGENPTIRKQSISDDGTTQSNESINQFPALKDGFYFTPNGTVERIPDGYYVSDGRLRKRRRSNSSIESSNGNIDTNRTETIEGEKFSSEIPLRIDGRGRKSKAKKISETQQRLTLVAMLSVASTALFSTVSIFGGKHWQLEIDESRILAENLNEALATLPAKTYEQIIGVIEKWVPWINLSFTLGAITIPRIEESIKQYKERNSKSDFRFNRDRERQETDTKFNESSLGWNG